MSATALKDLAKKQGLTGYGKLKKDQLIAAILDSANSTLEMFSEVTTRVGHFWLETIDK